MKIYRLLFASGKDRTIHAYSYTHDKALGKYYFHQKEDRSDKDSFVVADGVDGIVEQPTSEPVSLD
jgi:hypothetical protein